MSASFRANVSWQNMCARRNTGVMAFRIMSNRGPFKSEADRVGQSQQAQGDTRCVWRYKDVALDTP